MVDCYSVPVNARVPSGETNSYLVGDREVLLVDPAGHTAELDTVVEAETDTDADTNAVSHIAVTHTHPDHVGALAAYAAGTDATVWAHAAFTERFEQATGTTPDTVFRPGDEIGATGVTVMDTPGHAPDHVSFVVHDGTPETEVITGDLVFADGSAFVGSSDGDMRAYMASLRRVLASDSVRLHPGHGPTVENPRERLRTLYFHRRDRERRVCEAVVNGAGTVPDVLDAAYDKDLSGVRDLASETVRAHLKKLRVEGRIDRD